MIFLLLALFALAYYLDKQDQAKGNSRKNKQVKDILKRKNTLKNI